MVGNFFSNICLHRHKVAFSVELLDGLHSNWCDGSLSISLYLLLERSYLISNNHLTIKSSFKYSYRK